MHEGTTLELAIYRVNKAKEKLIAAKMMRDNKMYEDSVNRSYYAIFHAARALLAIDMKDFKKHSGVISYFQQNYIKPKYLMLSIRKLLLLHLI